jgi:CDP-paratose 2-epimerase
MKPPTPPSSDGSVLITGGAGFIGTNLAVRLLSAGRPVTIFDNLSRDGVDQNLAWLRQRYPQRLRFVHGDVRDERAVTAAVGNVSHVFHFAAQVAVTTSLVDPRGDFDVNARGTLNLLEAIRARQQPPTLIFTSTNKVYGHLQDVPMASSKTRYRPADEAIAKSGFGENRPLCFHSPYGCSKGAADQYVLDYAHTFDLPAVVFRMSCIYGHHQFGTEDQGWVAHFILQALRDESVTLYGDGRQVRDVLFVEDLIDAMLLAQGRIATTRGRAFNIGGGPANTTSLLELTALIETLTGRPMDLRFQPWRTADQKYYVSDTRSFEEATGWRARTSVREGVARLHSWLAEHRALPEPVRFTTETALKTGS